MGRESKPPPGKAKNQKANEPPAKDKGVAKMEVRHILVEKHSLALELIEKGLELNEEYEIVDKVTDKVKEVGTTVVAKAKKE